MVPADLPEYGQHRDGIGIAEAERVEVLRGAQRIGEPRREDHRALQN